MRYVLRLLVFVSWALWFGGTIASFVFAVNLFHTFQDRPDIAGQAAGSIFLIFGKYELILAGIALGCTVLMLVNHPSAKLIFLLSLLIFSGGMAMTFGMGVSPRIEELRTQGRTHSDEFKRLHGKSMILMTAQSVLLLGTGMLLMNTLKDSQKKVVNP